MYFRSSDQKSVDAFLKQITGIVEENLPDEHFGAARLAREAGMSRSAMHRRLIAITRKPATGFIREIRLNKALEMLLSTQETAAEIAYKTGFGSPAYFHHCFHQQFGCTPGEARKLDDSEKSIHLVMNSLKEFHANGYSPGRCIIPGLRQYNFSQYRLFIPSLVILFVLAILFILSL